MILPIYTLGQPILKKVCNEIDASYENLESLIENMWETMYAAKGVGLAAPQIGKQIRLFIVDTVQVFEEDEESEEIGVKQIFINAKKVEEEGELWAYEEGCLSIPNIRADVNRKEKLTIEFYDENFVKHVQTFEGINARVILHENDHVDGVLFIEHLKPLKRKMLKRKFDFIRKGFAEADYRLKPIR